MTLIGELWRSGQGAWRWCPRGESQATASTDFCPQPGSPYNLQGKCISGPLPGLCLPGAASCPPGLVTGSDPSRSDSRQTSSVATAGLHSSGWDVLSFVRKKPQFIFLTSNTGADDAGECTGEVPE